VAKVRFSRRAEADFHDITAYTASTCDAAQADRNLTLLDHYCQRLADTPALGRSCDHIPPGWLRARQAGHVVFFCRELTASRSSAARRAPAGQLDHVTLRT
jgi:plasmid stabilization system protein ParE